ncbi:MAG: Uma2 family endonuclease [Chloroflexi bacterium]|nr:Uma2 family endonuclease [Chloroflexota bacterium]
MSVQTRLYTIEEFEQFIAQPSSADKLFEYIGGEIVEVPSNPRVSEIAANVSFFIKLFLREQKIAGHVTGEAGGYRVSGERYAPDVAYLSAARQPQLAAEGYNPFAPELAVEVVSPSDVPYLLRLKVANYLKAGTVVWVVDSERQHVEIYVSGQSPRVIGIDGTVDGGEVLPGFTLSVKEIFRT